MNHNLTRLINDERGVSPVIGVVLMVSITVVLASVVGMFVLDLGSGMQETPQASFSYDGTDVVMSAGTNVPASELTVTIDGTPLSNTWTGTGPVSAGDTYPASATSGQTIRVVWHAPGGETSAILAEIEV